MTFKLIDNAIEQIEGIISNYIYSDDHCFLNTKKLLYNETNQSVIFQDYYPENHFEEGKKGTCFKLAMIAQKDIKNSFNEDIKDIRIVSGECSKFYGNHTFLLVNFNEGYVHDRSYFSPVFPEDTFVVDPSYNYVSALDHNYILKEDHQDLLITNDRDHYLSNKCGFPLHFENFNVKGIAISFKKSYFKLGLYLFDQYSESELFSCTKDLKTNQISNSRKPKNDLENKILNLVKFAEAV